jgi:hypothetical protein
MFESSLSSALERFITPATKTLKVEGQLLILRIKHIIH